MEEGDFADEDYPVTVFFKSTPENWQKEKQGMKPNTFRKIDEKDHRFETLRSGDTRWVTITNTETQEQFSRKITDYSEYKGWAIISWEHQEEK